MTWVGWFVLGFVAAVLAFAAWLWSQRGDLRDDDE